MIKVMLRRYDEETGNPIAEIPPEETDEFIKGLEKMNYRILDKDNTTELRVKKVRYKFTPDNDFVLDLEY